MAFNVKEAAELYYKTDQHFTQPGAYKVYGYLLGVLSQAGPDLGPPVAVKRWQELPGIQFLGSKARLGVADSGFFDPIIYGDFDLPEFVSVIANGTKREESGWAKERELYFSNRFPKDRFTNHYDCFFGGNYNILSYQTRKNNGRRLLVVSNSMDNSMTDLIASHFEETLFIDERSFNEFIGHPFVIDDYIANEKATDVLFLY